MRCNKGLGRSFARKLRLKSEKKNRGPNPNSPHHIKYRLKKKLGILVERPINVVVIASMVNEALEKKGIKHATARKRRKVARNLKSQLTKAAVKVAQIV